MRYECGKKCVLSGLQAISVRRFLVIVCRNCQDQNGFLFYDEGEASQR